MAEGISTRVGLTKMNFSLTDTQALEVVVPR